MKWAVLLTSCVRSTKPNDKRLFYYRRAIINWLLKTNLPLFIVESSGFTFPGFSNSRLNVCTCDLRDRASSSQYEADSILFAMDYFKDKLKDYTHILKVTARYYVNIENILPNIKDVDIVLQSQSNNSIEWNNSEIFGFRNGVENFLKEIATPNLGIMEKLIYKFSLTHSFDRLPPLKNIYKVPRGGDNLVVNPL